MAGSVNVTFSKIAAPYADTHGVIEVLIEWTADSSDGSVPQTDFDSGNSLSIFGRKCFMAVTVPGTTAPTDLYDIEILDEYGVDVFSAALHNRSAATPEQAVPLVGSIGISRLNIGTWTFKLTNNSVNSATGKCVLFFEFN